MTGFRTSTEKQKNQFMKGIINSLKSGFEISKPSSNSATKTSANYPSNPLDTTF